VQLTKKPVSGTLWMDGMAFVVESQLFGGVIAKLR
jgi:hypothetical protein